MPLSVLYTAPSLVGKPFVISVTVQGAPPGVTVKCDVTGGDGRPDNTSGTTDGHANVQLSFTPTATGTFTYTVRTSTDQTAITIQAV